MRGAPAHSSVSGRREAAGVAWGMPAALPPLRQPPERALRGTRGPLRGGAERMAVVSLPFCESNEPFNFIRARPDAGLWVYLDEVVVSFQAVLIKTKVFTH